MAKSKKTAKVTELGVKHTDAQLVEAYLGGWHTLMPVLTRLSRHQVAVLIRAELEGKKRKPLLTRLHQRLTRLRSAAELTELHGMAGSGNDRLKFSLPAWLTEELKHNGRCA